MQRLFVLAFALALGTSLAFAQATGGSTDTKIKTADSGKKATKAKGHKGGKKSGTSDAASKQELNPQPLPPGIKTGSTPKADAGPASAGDAQLSNQTQQPTGEAQAGKQLNPQPLPPRILPTDSTNKTKTKTTTKKGKKSSGDTNTGSTTPK